MREIQQQLNDLMQEWKQLHLQAGHTDFIADGAVCAEQYEQAPLKICFFLKEAYSGESGESWSLTDWLHGGAMTRMWGNVAEWAYGILHTSLNGIPKKPQLSRTQKSELLRLVSIVNVKKSGGKSGSDYADLLQYAISDRAFLRRELAVLRPDVIVCGYNASLLRVVYGAEVAADGSITGGAIDGDQLFRNGYALLGDQIILDYYHPANRYPAMLNYYALCGLYQQALLEKTAGK